jgi:hypothetical protein
VASGPTPHARWRIRLIDGLRARFVPEVPDGYLPLDEAGKRLWLRAVLYKVQRGELHAVQAVSRRRKVFESRSQGRKLDCLTNDSGEAGSVNRDRRGHT